MQLFILVVLMVLNSGVISGRSSTEAAQSLRLAFAAQAAEPGSQAVGAAYQPKSADDKAHSESEFTALAYMRTVAYSETIFFRRHNRYAGSLEELVGSSSFTRRMTRTDRGDYTVSFHAKPKGYVLVLVPQQFDAGHRSFFLDESGVFHAEPDKQATAQSPRLQ
jgi:hypothetical protein